MDHWACYREIMYIHLMCEGSSLLSNIICSVLDVKSFYLSHQQHLNQSDTAVRYLTYRMYQHEISVMSSLVKSWLTDLWTWFGTFVYIYPLGCGSSLLSNIICSVLDVKSFYLSHQQHLNQLEAAVEDRTYRMYQHEVSVMSSSVKSLRTDLWNCFWMIVYIYLINFGSSLLSNIICSVLDVKSFYLSYQQHLNQLEAAVEDMTYMIYLHVISVMTWVMLTLTDYWTWYRTIMGGVNLLGLDCGSGRGPNVYDASVYYYIFKMKYKSKLIV